MRVREIMRGSAKVGTLSYEKDVFDEKSTVCKGLVPPLWSWNVEINKRGPCGCWASSHLRGTLEVRGIWRNCVLPKGIRAGDWQADISGKGLDAVA